MALRVLALSSRPRHLIPVSAPAGGACLRAAWVVLIRGAARRHWNAPCPLQPACGRDRVAVSAGSGRSCLRLIGDIEVSMHLRRCAVATVLAPTGSLIAAAPASASSGGGSDLLDDPPPEQTVTCNSRNRRGC